MNSFARKLKAHRLVLGLVKEADEVKKSWVVKIGYSHKAGKGDDPSTLTPDDYADDEFYQDIKAKTAQAAAEMAASGLSAKFKNWFAKHLPPGHSLIPGHGLHYSGSYLYLPGQSVDDVVHENEAGGFIVHGKSKEDEPVSVPVLVKVSPNLAQVVKPYGDVTEPTYPGSVAVNQLYGSPSSPKPGGSMKPWSVGFEHEGPNGWSDITQHVNAKTAQEAAEKAASGPRFEAWVKTVLPEGAFIHPWPGHSGTYIQFKGLPRDTDKGFESIGSSSSIQNGIRYFYPDDPEDIRVLRIYAVLVTPGYGPPEVKAKPPQAPVTQHSSDKGYIIYVGQDPDGQEIKMVKVGSHAYDDGRVDFYAVLSTQTDWGSSSINPSKTTYWIRTFAPDIRYVFTGKPKFIHLNKVWSSATMMTKAPRPTNRVYRGTFPDWTKSPILKQDGPSQESLQPSVDKLIDTLCGESVGTAPTWSVYFIYHGGGHKYEEYSEIIQADTAQMAAEAVGSVWSNEFQNWIDKIVPDDVTLTSGQGKEFKSSYLKLDNLPAKGGIGDAFVSWHKGSVHLNVHVAPTSVGWEPAANKSQYNSGKGHIIHILPSKGGISMVKVGHLAQTGQPGYIDFYTILYTDTNHVSKRAADVSHISPRASSYHLRYLNVGDFQVPKGMELAKPWSMALEIDPTLFAPKPTNRVFRGVIPDWTTKPYLKLKSSPHSQDPWVESQQSVDNLVATLCNEAKKTWKITFRYIPAKGTYDPGSDLVQIEVSATALEAAEKAASRRSRPFLKWIGAIIGSDKPDEELSDIYGYPHTYLKFDDDDNIDWDEIEKQVAGGELDVEQDWVPGHVVSTTKDFSSGPYSDHVVFKVKMELVDPNHPSQKTASYPDEDMTDYGDDGPSDDEEDGPLTDVVPKTWMAKPPIPKKPWAVTIWYPYHLDKYKYVETVEASTAQEACEMVVSPQSRNFIRWAENTVGIPVHALIPGNGTLHKSSYLHFVNNLDKAVVSYTDPSGEKILVYLSATAIPVQSDDDPPSAKPKIESPVLSYEYSEGSPRGHVIYLSQEPNSINVKMVKLLSIKPKFGDSADYYVMLRGGPMSPGLDIPDEESPKSIYVFNFHVVTPIPKNSAIGDPWAKASHLTKRPKVTNQAYRGWFPSWTKKPYLTTKSEG